MNGNLETGNSKHFHVLLKVGDIVEATDKIWRQDNRSILEKGYLARVSRVSQNNPESPQIIGLNIQGQFPMMDIVCFHDVPLRFIHRP